MVAFLGQSLQCLRPQWRVLTAYAETDKQQFDWGRGYGGDDSCFIRACRGHGLCPCR